jgi:hypothetical protein
MYIHIYMVHKLQSLNSVLGKMKISAAKKHIGAPVYCWSLFLQCRAPQIGVVPSAALEHRYYLFYNDGPPLAGILNALDVALRLCRVAASLPQTEDQIDACQRAWDEVTDLHLEGGEVQAEADIATQRKRS